MHPNEELLRNGYAAFSSGDLDTVRELFHEDIQWHVLGKSSLAGDYKGRDDFFGFFAKLITETEGTFQVAVHDVLANDTHVVVLTNSKAQRKGKTLDENDIAVYHMSGGKAVEAWFFEPDQDASAAFYA